MRRFFLALLVPILLLSACGDKDSPAAAGSSGGDASSSDSDSARTVLPQDFCSLVTADEIAAAIGATVTTKTGPSGDCEFTQEDARGLSGSVGAMDLADLSGGIEGYQSGASASLGDPTVHDLTGIGEKAFFATGTIAGGTNLQGGGAALVGGALVTANLSQANDLSDAEVTGAGTKLLALAAGAL